MNSRHHACCFFLQNCILICNFSPIAAVYEPTARSKGGMMRVPSFVTFLPFGNNIAVRARKEVLTVSDTIIVALLSLLGSLGGTLGGIALNSKLSNYRIEQLEKKVDKHNNVVERVFKLEEHGAVIDEQIKVANHRIDDLEKQTA